MVYIHVRDWASDGVAAKLELVLSKQVSEKDFESTLLVAPHHEHAVCTKILQGLQSLTYM
jgi:hypothetical protein